MCVGINLQLPNVDIALFSAVLLNLNNNPSNFVCGFYERVVNSHAMMKYEPIINDFNLTKMRNPKEEKLIDGFCSYIDKVTQLYFSGFAKTRFYDVLPT